MKEKLSYKLYPWFSGLTDDLIFFVPVDMIYLTLVKGLNTAQISFSTSISILICIIIQFLVMPIFKKIGNQNSIKIGSFLFIIASLILLFSRSFIGIVIFKIFQQTAILFLSMDNALIKNNLKEDGRENDFIKLKNKSSLIYSLATMTMSFIIGPIYAINEHLPIVFSVILSIICFVFAFFIKESNPNEEKKSNGKIFFYLKLSNIIILIIIAYAVLFGAISVSQVNFKLLIQNSLELIYSEKSVPIYLGFIIAISRIVRVIANSSFNFIYNKLKDKIIKVLCYALIICFILIIGGYFISSSGIIKIIIISSGFILLIGIRDSIRNYLIDLALKNCSKDDQQIVLSYIDLLRKISIALISFLLGLALLKMELIYAIGILSIIAVIGLFIIYKLYPLTKIQE